MQDQSEQIRLVVGLGNPGREYAKSRHNIGFMVIDKLLEGLPGSYEESHIADSRLFSGRFKGRALYLQQPLTYMNESGRAVAGICRKLNITPEEVLVVSDDMDLPVGSLRLRRNGSDGGHNGLKSIIAELNSANFKRVRVGIGRPLPGGTVDHVLSEFRSEELEPVAQAIADAAEAIKLTLSCGLARAMNKFSGKAREPKTTPGTDEPRTEKL